MSKKWGNVFGHFSAFLNFGPFFGPFLGTVVENAKHKRVAPGNSLNFPNFPSIDIWVPKMRFSKLYIFGAPIESEGPGMVSSKFVKSPRGLDKSQVSYLYDRPQSARLSNLLSNSQAEYWLTVLKSGERKLHTQCL